VLDEVANFKIHPQVQQCGVVVAVVVEMDQMLAMVSRA